MGVPYKHNIVKMEEHELPENNDNSNDNIVGTIKVMQSEYDQKQNTMNGPQMIQLSTPTKGDNDYGENARKKSSVNEVVYSLEKEQVPPPPAWSSPNDHNTVIIKDDDEDSDSSLYRKQMMFLEEQINEEEDEKELHEVTKGAHSSSDELIYGQHPTIKIPQNEYLSPAQRDIYNKGQTPQ